MADESVSEEIGGNQLDERSDADTDDLLNSADLLCSGAEEKQRPNIKQSSSNNHTPIKSINPDWSTLSPKLTPSKAKISSVRRTLNFETDHQPEPISERKKHSKLNQILDNVDRSQSCPSTPKSDFIDKCHVSKKITFSPTISKIGNMENEDLRSIIAQKSGGNQLINLPFSIPSNSYAIVQFASKQLEENFDDENDEGDLISDKQAELLRSLLNNAKIELNNANQLIVRAMSSNIGHNRSNDSSILTSLSMEERTFLEKLSPNELRELYEAEFCKRRYCEKKIDILQKQLLDIEQKLSVVTVTVERYRNVISNVDESCNEFITDVSTKEKERKIARINLKKNNDRLKIALEQVIDYGRLLGEKLETSQERIGTLEKETTNRSTTVTKLEIENKKYQEESISQQSAIQNLRRKLEQSETKRKASFEKEEQLTKELLLMERIGKENSDLIQKLKNELNQEKSMRRNQLEEKERQYKDRMTELAKDFDTRVEKTKQEIEHKKANEMKKLKDEWDSVLYGLSEKYQRMVNERDEALRRLKEYEDTFTERQRIMCYELQQRLSAKYYELLTEFSPPNTASSNNGNANGNEAGAGDLPSDIQMGNNVQASGGNNTTQYQNQNYQAIDQGWLSCSMADEFLDRLRNVYPMGGTPRNYGNEVATKQAYPGVNQRACPPPDGSAKKK